ncbi:hypothetical protein Zmor_005517 [Zophobas morio]|uniref:Sulfhydryl oxidase n=1 Tax=Zophobas morio TaxID=2755281 RepID=A0AA38MLT1_9CUCU|nr:hypothetical protein Zmor_005517 [Zophobas morio]
MKIIVFVVLTLFIANIQTAPIGGLYLPDDDVEILNGNNFKKFVENSTNAWTIEFYASWCGYCQRFAPSWKEFATEAASWRDIVRIGVVECSDEQNINLCRDFGITKYPTVRYFHENYHTGLNHSGVIVPHASVYSLEDNKKSAIETFIAEQYQGRGQIYPHLLPYGYPDLKDLFSNASQKAKFAFLVFEENSYLGGEVAMDLHRTSEIAVTYSLQNNTELINNLKVETFPSLYAVDRSNNAKIFTEGIKTRTELKETIGTFLKDKGIKLIEIVPSKLQNSSVDPDPNQRSRTILRQYVKKMGDVVFQRDLEAALRYSLQQEVSTIQLIKDEQLQALNAYVKVIKKYFPFGYNGSSLIDKLANLTSTSTEIEGPQIQLLVQKAEENREFSSPQRFIGCLGSSSRYRGYPCSLWRLFHFLTVNSLLYNVNNKKANPREVLDAMHGYVKNFFSCQHCSQHFQKMAAERNLGSVASLEESVFWLWEAHNVVNARLSGDETEDPEYPKEQFPTKLRCRECYGEDGSWIRSEVLKYLKRMYGNYNVRYIGSDTNVLFPGLD